MVDEVRQRSKSVPRRITRRVLVHMLIEELRSVISQYALPYRVHSREIVAIDRVFGETARLEGVGR